MGERIKLYVAGFILALAIAAWVGSFAVMIAFYYQMDSHKFGKLKPTAEKKADTYWKLLELEQEFEELQLSAKAPAHLELDGGVADYVEALDAKIEELKNNIENEKRDAQTYKEQADEALRPFGEALQQFQDTRADFKEKIKQAKELLKERRETLNAEVETQKDRISALDQEIRTLSSQIAEMEDEHRNKRNKLLVEYEKYRKLFEQIQAKNMQEQYGTDKIDGTVLLANIQKNFVMLDLGKRDRIRKGMKFRVLALLKGVRPIEKGMVEIREVFDTVAYARILSMPDPENPIQSGDGVANDLYDRDEQLTFVLVGKLEGFNRVEFTRFVEEMGDKVAQSVDTNTDYLIVGTGIKGKKHEEEQVEIARELGVKIITENFFMRLVRYE
ncbi:MAG: BRCT domain-containing protein [Planctomycetota bacterium]|nr:BRCT domain-containing protein [Planctomycetota bacterium]